MRVATIYQQMSLRLSVSLTWFMFMDSYTNRYYVSQKTDIHKERKWINITLIRYSNHRLLFTEVGGVGRGGGRGEGFTP